jgi:predicted enzyme related to lactoylglutathione lyase
MENPVRWFEIYVQDMDRAKRFYENVFQVKLQKLNTPAPGLDMWQFPSSKEAMGCAGALVQMKGVPSGGMGTIVYFGSDDCAVEEKRIAKAGGKIERPKMAIGQYGFITLAYDPDGNMFGIHSMN